jgi:hypothetical protein
LAVIVAFTMRDAGADASSATAPPSDPDRLPAKRQLSADASAPHHMTPPPKSAARLPSKRHARSSTRAPLATINPPPRCAPFRANRHCSKRAAQVGPTTIAPPPPSAHASLPENVQSRTRAVLPAAIRRPPPHAARPPQNVSPSMIVPAPWPPMHARARSAPCASTIVTAGPPVPRRATDLVPRLSASA